MVNLADIASGFEYDLWANKLWLAYLNRTQASEEDRGILAHTLSAQKIWLVRCHGNSLNHMPEVPLTEGVMAELSAEWANLLRTMTHDPEITYQRTTGETMTSRLSDIALHVVNHGTYHRGELRGLCRARKAEDFPETDRLRFVFTQHGEHV